VIACLPGCLAAWLPDCLPAVLPSRRLTVGEEWCQTMYWYARYTKLGHGYPQGVVQILMISMFLWMSCILFSLYVAMLLEHFNVSDCLAAWLPGCLPAWLPGCLAA
jgi:hypothetical protein